MLDERREALSRRRKQCWSVSNCKRSASMALPQRCHRVPPKCNGRRADLLEDCISAETAERVYTIEAAHNPEVAGSNPAPATAKGAGNGAFRFSQPRGYFTVTVKQSLCTTEPSLPSSRHCTSKLIPSTRGAPREISKCSAPAPPFEVVKLGALGGGSIIHGPPGEA